MRIRLRPAHTPETLASMYAVPHDSDHWQDHRERVARTIALIAELVGPVQRAADLSCGNGRILKNIDAEEKVFGDLAPGWPITGPIERTLPDLERVDLLVMSETLEHLDDPDGVLAVARKACDVLVLSTPTNEAARHNDENPEHYWSWGLDDLAGMLLVAGFTDLTMRLLPLGYYDYQLWVAR